MSIRLGPRGSLALTGIGHGTPKAVILGLHGLRPSEVDPDNHVRPKLDWSS